MRLDQLIEPDAPAPEHGAQAVEIGGLAYDSRRVHSGDLFFCVSGFERDGHDFAPEAVRRGAGALVVERALGLGVPEALVPNARALMAPVAARFNGDPTRTLRVLAVTGTNGKTTTTFLLRAMLEASARPCGLLGTVKSVIGGREQAVTRTTPEAIDLQADFRAMLDAGDTDCAMEVSSHALELGRARAIHFQAAIFTNLTHEHLDFHPSMEAYFAVKRRLFAPDADDGSHAPGTNVVNVADPYGARLAAQLEHAVTFAVRDERADAGAPDALYVASDLRCERGGCRFQLRTPDADADVRLPMAGRFNVANALGAIATLHTLGFELEALVGALERGVHVPGRFEPVDEGQDFAVLVDYAHTPDSLENVLGAARELAQLEGAGHGRVVCVFGAGGDRDRAKRPLMGAIAARMAEGVIVTSDNPRSEDPDAIVAEILAGAQPAQRPRRALPLQVEVDRRSAIARAVELAERGDVLVIAGKGHEQGQELADGHKVPFDDVAVAREALRAAAAPAGTG